MALILAIAATACSASGETVSSARVVVEPTVKVIATTPPVPIPTVAEATAAPAPSVAAQPPTVEPTTVPIPTATPQPDGPCSVGPLALPAPTRPRYEATITVDPSTGLVAGNVSVDFTPDLPIDEIVLRLWPNGPRPASGGVEMTVSNVHVDGTAAEIESTNSTLITVGLDETLPAGDTVRLSTDFELIVPGELNSRISRQGDYMRLGTFLPLLPWEPGIGWAKDPATPLFAEAVSSPVADYSVAITVPDGFDVLASGVDDGTGVWNVEAARDFAVSVGRFRTVTAVANAPSPVQVTIGVHETLDDNPDAYLANVVNALESFSSRWGQYPWPSLSLALTPALGGGIEFPTHILQGPGTIGRTTTHEVGHMFFYSLVGNNQAVAPWLDEGITSYAEFTYEGTQPGAYSIPGDGVGLATEPMTFWSTRGDIYYRSVYGQTGFALQRLGPQDQVDCALARYVADNAHTIATAADFVAAFEPTFPDVRDQLALLGVVIEAE